MSSPSVSKDVPIRLWLVVGLAFAALIAVAVVATEVIWSWAGTKTIYAELLKIFFQFLLVTIFGAGLFSLIALIRDQNRDRAERIAEDEKQHEIRFEKIVALEEELGKTYRDMKIVRRTLRSKVPFALLPPPWTVDAADLRQTMNEMLQVQIRMEALDDLIPLRSDLFPPDRRERLSELVHYSSRYLHSVFEDFERQRVRFTGATGTIGTDCIALLDFIGHAGPPPPSSVDQYLRQLETRDATLQQRYEALQKINAERKAGGTPRRFEAVSYECFKTAAEELRRAAEDEARAGPRARFELTAPAPQTLA